MFYFPQGHIEQVTQTLPIFRQLSFMVWFLFSLVKLATGLSVCQLRFVTLNSFWFLI